MINISKIKRWLWPTQNNIAGHSPVAIPDPLKPMTHRYHRKPVQVMALRWDRQIGYSATALRDAFRKMQVPLDRTIPPMLMKPLSKCLEHDDIHLLPRTIPDGAWIIFAPIMPTHLWWITDQDFNDLYTNTSDVSDRGYSLTVRYGPEDRQYTSVYVKERIVQATRKADTVKATQWIGADGETPYETSQRIQRYLCPENPQNAEFRIGHAENPANGDWIVMNQHNKVWVVESDAFDVLYTTVAEY